MTYLKPLTALAAAIGLTATAYAMTMDETVDANGDGVYSLEELQAVLPDLTEDTFIVVDTNEDGLIDEAEFAVASEAGIFPPEES
ncbi:hypothetical protein [Shimia ponticola]|uniref:hypothetical protein n=1 Tax=Shimia ponticola TaxID=2582893 RepID=UPI002106E71C|nr:hypothetical protein [Shimia ponticola]